MTDPVVLLFARKSDLPAHHRAARGDRHRCGGHQAAGPRRADGPRSYRMRLLQADIFNDEPTHQIVCDEPSCTAVIEADTASQARERAVAAGWTVSEEEDLCPEHQP